MEESIKFNSQICTTKEQSKKLLEIGLKPETADCRWIGLIKDLHGKDIPIKKQIWSIRTSDNESSMRCGFTRYECIPAWSLSRLIELYSDVDDTSLLHITNVTYKLLIFCIEKAIHCNVFNEQYLNK